MNLISPKNAFVEEVLVANEAVVEAGTAVLRLDSEAERLRYVRATSLRDIALIMAKRFEPADSTAARTVADASVSLADTNVGLKKAIHAQVKARVEMAVLDVMNLDAAASDLEQAQILSQQTRAQHLLFSSALDRAKQQSDQLIDALSKELELIEAQMERLTLRAPLGGKIAWHVAKGSFVRQGDVIGEVA